MDELIFAGNKYISSKRASKLTGYTTDYIGQICRADKIECRLVGRNWYINEREIERNKKRFKKEQVASQNAKSEAIEYEKIAPELLYYSNDKRSLNPEVSKINYEDTEENPPAGGEENIEEDIPIRVIKKPEVSVERYVQPRIISKVEREIIRRQRTVPQQIKKRLPMVAPIAAALMLAGVLFIVGTFILEQAIYYSSEDKTSIDTSIQLANVSMLEKTFDMFRVQIQEFLEL